MTIDHKPDLESERDRIYRADGYINSGRIKGNLNLSRSLGDLEYKQKPGFRPEDQMITANPDIRIEPLNKDVEFIIMGCDGIWECLSNDEAVNLVRSEITKNPKENPPKNIGTMVFMAPRWGLISN